MFTHELRLWIEDLKEGEIFFSKTAYDNYFQNMEESTFYQLTARLYNEGSIGKIGKGLYYRPYKCDPDQRPSDIDIINFFTDKLRKGTIVGGHKFLELGLIENVDEPYTIYTNAFEIKTHRVIDNFIVHEVQLDYKNPAVLNTLYMFEIINNIDQYEFVDIDKLKEFIDEFIKTYKEDIVLRLLNNKNYKKRDLYVLVEILNSYNIKNNFIRYLNKASKYRRSEHITRALTLIKKVK